MKLDLSKLNMWLTFSVMLFIYGFFAYGANAAYSIGLILTPLLFVFEGIFNGRSLIQSFRNTIKKEEVLSILLVMLLLSECFSTLINYPRGMHSLLLYQGPILAIGAIMLFLPAENKWLLIRAFFPIVLIALAYGIYNFSWDTFAHHDIHQRFARNSNIYTVLLLPFLIAYAFLASRRNKLRVAIVVVVTLYLLTASLWTGERGAWGSIFIEGLILAWIFARVKYLSSKTLLLIMFAGIVLTSSAGLILYHENTHFKRQVDRGLGLDGRGTIVRTRFPLFIKSNKTILGFGYSDNAYNDFFNEKGAPHVYGTMQNGKYHYNQDGPFYLQLFYHFGATGLLIFLIFTLYFLYRIHKRRTSASTQLGRLFYAALLASFVGYFIIGGLFEGRTTYYMLFMYFLFMTGVDGLEYEPVDEKTEETISTKTI